MREVTIERLGAGGDGVAENGTLFVPFTLPGERARVELEPDGKHARLVELIEPSPERDRADLSSFRDLRRLRAPASGAGGLSPLEA